MMVSKRMSEMFPVNRDLVDLLNEAAKPTPQAKVPAPVHAVAAHA
jgi:hypothetical protein